LTKEIIVGEEVQNLFEIGPEISIDKNRKDANQGRRRKAVETREEVGAQEVEKDLIVVAQVHPLQFSTLLEKVAGPNEKGAF
jgi:hypothetical protein